MEVNVAVRAQLAHAEAQAAADASMGPMGVGTAATGADRVGMQPGLRVVIGFDDRGRLVEGLEASTEQAASPLPKLDLPNTSSRNDFYTDSLQASPAESHSPSPSPSLAEALEGISLDPPKTWHNPYTQTLRGTPKQYLPSTCYWIRRSYLAGLAGKALGPWQVRST